MKRKGRFLLAYTEGLRFSFQRFRRRKDADKAYYEMLSNVDYTGCRPLLRPFDTNHDMNWYGYLRKHGRGR